MGNNDLSGMRFSRLTVIRKSGYKKKESVVWVCRCDCGTFCSATTNHLKMGKKKSCGCITRENAASGDHKRKHGMTRTKIYQTWLGIKKRCNNPNEPNFRNYGARGIKICKEWENDFSAFQDYVSALPHYGEEGYSIDRIDNDGDYEPENVRWATRHEQNTNRRDSIFYEEDGMKIPIIELAVIVGTPYPTLKSRYQQHREILTKEEKEKLRNGSKNRNLSTTG